MALRIPNFFIVGAAKSGTTSVARYLDEHPQVYMSPIKEPSYFARDIIETLHPPGWARNQRGLDRYLNGPMLRRRGGCVLEWEDYLKLFRKVADEIAIGEASVAIAAASPHRADAFAACRYAIERVKQIAPVWKHEFFEDGDAWVEGAVADPNDDLARQEARRRACA